MTQFYIGSASSDYFNYDGSEDLIAHAYGGDDVILGNYGNDTIYGYDGSDTLYGYIGNDYLDGYGYTYYEYDTLVGGSGSDTFAIADGSGNTQYAPGGWDGFDGYATITDYNYWEGDVIQLGWNDYWNYSSNTFLDYNGNGVVDTALYYGNNLLAIISDTSTVGYSYV